MAKKSAQVTWLRDLTFDAEMEGHHITIDASPGFGNDRGPTPGYLLMVSLAGCTAMDAISILKKKRQPIEGFVVRVETEQAEDHPKWYRSFALKYEVQGAGVDRKAVERAVELSIERYCTVHATLLEVPEISTEIVLVDPESEDGSD